MFFPIDAISLFAAFAALFCAVSPIQAAPTLQSRDVFVPPILYPNAGTVWHAGQTHNVTWDASNPPKSISNRASIVLRTADINSGWTQLTLVSDFSLLAARQEIKVPTNVTTRDDWEIVLFGDSGNISPAFTILAP